MHGAGWPNIRELDLSLDRPPYFRKLGDQAKVAADLGVSERTVGKWRTRFLHDRIGGLLDEARSGRPRSIDDDAVAASVERATLYRHEQPRLNKFRLMSEA